MKSQQSGFTLIELIVVIIILGVLAATALPRYTDIQVRARIAKLNGALGSVRAASALAHAQCLAKTTPCGTNDAVDTLSMEGVNNVKVINQYPQAASDGIVLASGISTTNPADFVTTGGGATSTSSITISIPGIATGTCEFIYNAATWDTTNSVVVAPTITGINTTCQ